MEYTLPRSCSEQLNDLLKNSTIDPYKQWESYHTTAEQLLLDVLPNDLKEILVNMRTNNTPTALIIHNMPIDNYIPSTPKQGIRPLHKTYFADGKEVFHPDAKGYVSETTLLGICSLFDAFPDFDENEKDGTYINQIIPVDDLKNRQDASSLGSEVAFEFHTENIYQNPPLKYLSLLCLRGDSKVATRILFLDTILDYIKENPHPTLSYEQVIEEMQKPQFIMRTGPSFKDTTIESILPILTKNAHNETVFRFNVNNGRISGVTQIAQDIVDYLRQLLSDNQFKDTYATRIYLKAGDFLLINNWEVMHARDAFKIDYDNWRWLQRCYIMLNSSAQS